MSDRISLGADGATFAPFARSYAEMVHMSADTKDQEQLGIAQILGAYLNNARPSSEKEAAQLLAEVVETALQNMPELRYEFNLALQLLQETN